MTHTENDVTAKRERILQAAQRRFNHYGYEKTTMAEIAEDAGMAVGTLYLFFKNKADIVFAYGQERFLHFEQTMKEVCLKNLPAVEKLIELMKTKCLVMKNCMEESPHGGEIIRKMQEAGHNTCCQFARTEKGILERVIRQGIEEGAFYVEDPARTATAYYTAFAGYFPPHSLGKTREEIEQGIEDLTDLLIKGLRAAMPESRREAEARDGERNGAKPSIRHAK